MSNLYRGHSIDVSYQVSVHLAKRFQRRRIKKKTANLKQESPVAAMYVNGSGRNKPSLQRTFYRCFLPSFGSFGKAVSEEMIFRNRPIRNKNCLWRPCLLMDRGLKMDSTKTVVLIFISVCFFYYHQKTIIDIYVFLYMFQNISILGGPGGSMSQVVGSNNSYKPITNTAWVRARLCKLQKGVHSTRSFQ